MYMIYNNMNGDGNQPEQGLIDGGTIGGDLDINGNLIVEGDAEFENIIVNDTATITTLITQQDLEVIDPLVLFGKDNPSDLVNLGYKEEFIDGVKKWSGFIRSKDDKFHYLLESSTVKPLPNANITSYPLGDFKARFGHIINIVTDDIDSINSLGLGVNTAPSVKISKIGNLTTIEGGLKIIENTITDGNLKINRQLGTGVNLLEFSTTNNPEWSITQGASSSDLSFKNSAGLTTLLLEDTLNRTTIPDIISAKIRSLALSKAIELRTSDINISSPVSISSSIVSPDSSSALDITSTTQGILIPRLTTVQRDLITSPATGLILYNTTNNDLELYNGSAWVGTGGEEENPTFKSLTIEGDNDGKITQIRATSSDYATIEYFTGVTSNFTVGTHFNTSSYSIRDSVTNRDLITAFGTTVTSGANDFKLFGPNGGGSDVNLTMFRGQSTDDTKIKFVDFITDAFSIGLKGSNNNLLISNEDNTKKNIEINRTNQLITINELYNLPNSAPTTNDIIKASGTNLIYSNSINLDTITSTNLNIGSPSYSFPTAQPANGNMALRVNGAGTAIIFSTRNQVATGNPTVNDDDGDGYGINSLWTNQTTDKSFICVDPTSTSSIWKEILFIENNKIETEKIEFTSPTTGVNQIIIPANLGSGLIIKDNTFEYIYCKTNAPLEVNLVQNTRAQQELLVQGKLTASQDVQTSDQTYIRMGTTSATTPRGVIYKFVADETIEAYRVLKIVDFGGVARVRKILNTDPESTGVIGVSLTPATIGQDIDVVVGGIFEATVANGAPIAIGNNIEVTDSGAAGCVVSNPVSPGIFAVALTSGTGNPGLTVKIKAIMKQSESF